MKTIAFFLLINFFCWGQEGKIIKVYSTKIGRDNSHKLIYPEISAKLKIKSLAPARHKFYIRVNDSCRVMLHSEKHPQMPAEEIAIFNNYISDYRLQYFEGDELVPDCRKYSSLFFPIKITLE